MASLFEIQSDDKSPHSITAGDLRVVFPWRGDRYGHRVERLVEGAWRIVLESVEGSAGEDWPFSPVLQSLHIEQRPAGAVALLVGKAGVSHWSASVEPFDSSMGLRFDIACRTGQAPRHLGSSYCCATNSAARLIEIATKADSSAFQDHPDQDHPDGAPTMWRIAPTEMPRELPATVRWRYSISPAMGSAL